MPKDLSFDDLIPEQPKQKQVGIRALSFDDLVPISPMDGISGPQRFLEGVGKGFADIGRGIGQRVGLVDEKEVAESRKRDEVLTDTGAGSAGHIAGNIAAFLPAALLPGANTVAGAALLGGASGLAQPTVEGESTAKNAALGAILGGGAQHALGKVATFAGNRLAAKEAAGTVLREGNAVKDSAIAEAKAAGYKTIPSVSEGSFVGRVVEGLTGKEKAKQLASVNNQPVTDKLARKALDLPESAPLTHETMKAVRAEAAAKGYEPIRQIPRMDVDILFRRDISKLTSRADNAAKDFGSLVESDIKPFVEELKKIPSFSGDTAVDTIAIFREKASELYAAGNKTAATAHRRAAEALEAQVERGLARSGKDGAKLIKDFRAARTKMARSFDVEKALREGEGKVDARVLGKLYNKSPDRLSGELQTVGRSAAAMPDVMAVPKDGWANPVTALDSGFATFGGILAGNPLPLAYPVLRAGARYGLMSGPGQKMFTNPQYGPGAAAKIPPKLLEELRRYGAGGLLGSVYAAQQ